MKTSVDDQLKEAKRRLKAANEEISRLNIAVSDLDNDRSKYRSWCLKHYRWQLQFLAENKSADPRWVIEDMSKLFNSTETFFWGLK